MPNPYDHNPFIVDDYDIVNERDANRALSDSVNRAIAYDEGDDIHNDDYWEDDKMASDFTLYNEE